MHPYTVKNYLWVAIIVMMVVLFCLTGCSSAPKVQAKKPQYCHTSQTIVKENDERVNSQTVVECTDDQIKRLSTVKMGLASNCGEFTYWMKQGDKNVQRKGISCQKHDGSWEIVNTPY